MTWLWIIAAFYAGLVFGYGVAALMSAAKRADVAMGIEEEI